MLDVLLNYHITKGKLSVNISGANYLESEPEFVLKARLIDRFLRDKIFNLEKLKVDESKVFSINVYYYVLSKDKRLLDYMFEALRQYLVSYAFISKHCLPELSVNITNNNSYIQTIVKDTHIIEVGMFDNKFAFINKVSQICHACKAWHGSLCLKILFLK